MANRLLQGLLERSPRAMLAGLIGVAATLAVAAPASAHWERRGYHGHRHHHHYHRPPPRYYGPPRHRHYYRPPPRHYYRPPVRYYHPTPGYYAPAPGMSLGVTIR